MDRLVRESGLPRHELERLVMLVTGKSRAEVLSGIALDFEQETALRRLTGRLRTGEPIQYLEGMVPFGPIEVTVDRRVLIPRPETEYLFEQAAAVVGDPGVIVDLCTGSGNLALALKHRFPQARVLASDISSDALAVALANADRLGLTVELLLGDLFEPLPRDLVGAVDLIVANPPYVADSEVAGLPAVVRDHEPLSALVAGPEGDEVLRRIAAQASVWLAPGAWLCCEIGERQEERATELFRSTLEVEIRRDLAGRPRYVVGQRP